MVQGVMGSGSCAVRLRAHIYPVEYAVQRL